MNTPRLIRIVGGLATGAFIGLFGDAGTYVPMIVIAAASYAAGMTAGLEEQS